MPRYASAHFSTALVLSTLVLGPALVQGAYSGQLSPARSGTASLPITFAAYTGGTPTPSGISKPALWPIQRSYIVVDGLTVTSVGGWGRLEDATHNTF